MWPWRRRTTSDAGPAPAAPAPARLPVQRGEWRGLPPIQRTVRDHPLVNPVQRFSGSLASWQDPSRLAPLGHRVGPAEPAGTIAQLARPVAGPELPVVAAEPVRAGPVRAGPVSAERPFWSRIWGSAGGGPGDGPRGDHGVAVQRVAAGGAVDRPGGVDRPAAEAVLPQSYGPQSAVPDSRLGDGDHGGDSAVAFLDRPTLAEPYAAAGGAEPVDAQPANLQLANVQRAAVQGVDPRRAAVRGADLHNALVQNADVHGAAVQRTDPGRAVVQRADFQLADVVTADVPPASAESVDAEPANAGPAYVPPANAGTADVERVDVGWASADDAHVGPVNAGSADAGPGGADIATVQRREAGPGSTGRVDVERSNSWLSVDGTPTLAERPILPDGADPGPPDVGVSGPAAAEGRALPIAQRARSASPGRRLGLGEPIVPSAGSGAPAVEPVVQRSFAAPTIGSATAPPAREAAPLPETAATRPDIQPDDHFTSGDADSQPLPGGPGAAASTPLVLTSERPEDARRPELPSGPEGLPPLTVARLIGDRPGLVPEPPPVSAGSVPPYGQRPADQSTGRGPVVQRTAGSVPPGPAPTTIAIDGHRSATGRPVAIPTPGPATPTSPVLPLTTGGPLSSQPTSIDPTSPADTTWAEAPSDWPDTPTLGLTPIQRLSGDPDQLGLVQFPADRPATNHPTPVQLSSAFTAPTHPIRGGQPSVQRTPDLATVGPPRPPRSADAHRGLPVPGGHYVTSGPAARPVLQRQDFADPPPSQTPATDPAPAAPEPMPAAQADPPPATTTDGPTAAAAATAAGAAAGAAATSTEPDELLKKLFDPLLRRLKAELRLDRERRGALTDLRH